MHALCENILFQPYNPRTLLRQVIDFITKHFSILAPQIKHLPAEMRSIIEVHKGGT